MKTTDTLSAALAAPVGSIEEYTRFVNAIPMLSEGEEADLARRYRRDGDLEAARRLVMSHLRFVAHIARGYAGYGLPHADLIQEGNIGLMKAVKRYDPEQNVRLASFAIHWIRAEIHEFVLRNWRIVKVATTKAQRKLFFNLRSKRKQLGWMDRAEVERIADELNVDPSVVTQMEGRMSGQDIAFDGYADEDDDEGGFAPSSWLADSASDPALLVEQSDSERDSSQRLVEALEALDPRSRDILQRRWLAEPKATLHELAAEYGVSAERIRQIEAQAIKRLRGALEA